jgi:hypothetical protein
MVTWKGFGRRRLWHNLKVLSWYSPRRTEENYEKLRTSRSPGQDLNLGSPECEAGVLSINHYVQSVVYCGYENITFSSTENARYILWMLSIVCVCVCVCARARVCMLLHFRSYSCILQSAAGCSSTSL